MKFFCSSLMTVIMIQDRKVFFKSYLNVLQQQSRPAGDLQRVHCLLSLAVTVLQHFLLTTLLIT